MKAAALDREVTILARLETTDPDYGTKSVTWSSDPDDGAFTVWAQVQDVLPSRADRLADDISIANRPARVRMDYRDGIGMDDRIEIDGRQMRVIAGPAEVLGDRHSRPSIEIMVQQLSTEGEQA